MTSKTLDFANELLVPDRLASAITDTWIRWDMLRNTWKANKEEVRKYVYATDTTQTTNSQLPWKNKTTIPKLCHIRDNLYSNYVATLFPQRKWLIWEANEHDANSAQKRDSIINYMAWSIEQPSFKSEVDKLILDYIDFGNCFATVEWIDERVTQKNGIEQSGYVGPSIRRVNPLNIVMNPTTEAFEYSPKIVRSIISKGDLKKMLDSQTTPENEKEYQELWTYLKDIRANAESFTGDWIQNDRLYAMDGFTSFRDYLNSEYCEILTFYGDVYDDENEILLQNHVITVVDRHKLIGKKPNPSFFATPPIFHSAWRKRQDNLWGMGPLDNLVGMQYRLDHVENMRADIVDLTTYPVQKVKGYVQDYTWQPGEKIYTSEEGDVDLVQPKTDVLNANFELGQLEAKMEEMAGAPKEAMGFRTPGEKTKYEVQRLENAASRVFQNKIKQFEEQIIEPSLNAMLELARRNLTGSNVIKVFDDELKATTFQSLTVEDITGIGRIRPIAARHFAEQANLVQNLTNMTGSALWQSVSPHFSGIKMAKMLESIFDLTDYEIVLPYIALAEQADAQKMAHALEAQVMQNVMTATGRGIDHDEFTNPQVGPTDPGTPQMPSGPVGPQAPPGAPPTGAPPPQAPPFNLKRQPPPNAQPGGLLGTD